MVGDDLLTLSRIESGAVERSAADLADVVLESVETFRPVAEAEHIELSVTSIVPSVAKGDRSQLRRVVSNLLDNALKYTEPAATCASSSAETRT
jgi:two-component system phosphate regulon sensor histidine kinase PhoR